MEKKKLNIVDRSGLPPMESGFKIPEGYFDSFGDRLKLRMEAEHLSSHRRRSIIRYLKPALGLAAALAIILTVYLYPPGNQRTGSITGMNQVGVVTADSQPDLLTSTYASLITDVQFITALNEMDDYDTSKMPKEVLADYLASNCSDFEILNDSN